MGHFRFATTASDMGGLLIEDLAAVPDLAAASFNEVLARLGLAPEADMPKGLLTALGSSVPLKIRYIASWLAGNSSTLVKVNIAIDEGPLGCRVRRIAVRVKEFGRAALGRVSGNRHTNIIRPYNPPPKEPQSSPRQSNPVPSIPHPNAILIVGVRRVAATCSATTHNEFGRLT